MSTNDSARRIADSDLVSVGLFERPHGLKGEIALKRQSAEFPYKTILAGGRSLTVSFTRPHRAVLLVRFKEVTSREEAKTLTGKEALVKRSDLPDRPAGEIYLCDLPGMTIEDERGCSYGPVRDVKVLAGRDYLELKSGTLVPFDKDLLLGLDRATGIIRMKIPEGLL